MDATSSKPLEASKTKDNKQEQATKQQYQTNAVTSGDQNDKDSKGNSKITITNKQDAVNFAMSRFSLSEINHIRQLASGELTPKKKAELKKIAYSKFTAVEIEAVRKVVDK